MKKISIVVFVLSLFVMGSLFSVGTVETNKKNVLVFVPGITAGSPIYEQLVSGATKAVATVEGSSIKVVEGGFNQADWLPKLKLFASQGNWDYIITSNPAMPEICAEVVKSFPKQKFIILDGYLKGNPNIQTNQYNQTEQSYMVGYLAALTSMENRNTHKIGIIVAQNYPVLDKIIIPGFLQGAKAADPLAEVEVRVIGNWYDANKALELSNVLIDSGCDVLFPIAGGASQGVLSAAKARSKKVVYFDGNGYALAPNVIIGCAILNQEKLAYEKIKLALEGKLVMGEALILSVKDGYVDFDDKDPLYKKSVSSAVFSSMQTLLNDIRTGKKSFNMPSL